MTLILDMPMQDSAASSAVDDVSASNNNGIAQSSGGAVNTNTLSTTGVEGSLTKALNLTAASGNFISLTSSITRSAVQAGCIQFYGKRASTAADHTVFGNSGGGTRLMFVAGGHSLHFRDSDFSELLIATGVITTDFHHYAIVLATNGTANLYTDGVLVGALSGARTGDSVFNQWGADGANRYFNGPLCGSRVYDTIRTQAEIQADRELGLTSSGNRGWRAAAGIFRGRRR